MEEHPNDNVLFYSLLKLCHQYHHCRCRYFQSCILNSLQQAP